MDVHLHGGFFEFLVVDTSHFTRCDHSAIELCPLPSRLSNKRGEGQEGQEGHLEQIAQMGYPGQAGQIA